MESDDWEDDDWDGWPWCELGLEGAPTGDEAHRIVRRAYAKRLKSIDAASDVAAFAALRSAYETALEWTQPAGAVRAPVMPAFMPPDTRAPRVRVASSADGARPDAAPAVQNDETPPAVRATRPWGAGTEAALADPDLLMEYVGRLLRGMAQSIEEWQQIYASPLLDDPFIRSQVEWRVVEYLSSPGVFATVNGRDFAAQADARFGWSADGIGFLRRYPLSADFLGRLASLTRDVTAKRAEPRGDQNLPVWARWYSIIFVIGIVGTVAALALRGTLFGDRADWGMFVFGILTSPSLVYLIFSILMALLHYGADIFAYIFQRFLWWQRLRNGFMRRWVRTRLGRFSPGSVLKAGAALAVSLLLLPLLVSLAEMDEAAAAKLLEKSRTVQE